MKIYKRHIAKSFTWRFIGTVDTFIFTWFITGGNIEGGINLSVATIITKLFLYYIHERLWFNKPFIDSNKRHILKTFSWRFIGTIDTVVIGWLILGNPYEAFKIGLLETVSKMVLYFWHEKLWYKINFGLDKRIRAKRLKKLGEKIN